ncbi:MAG: mobile mystery protein B [Halieaceae bacterium]|nr:mobile mystery protein B [Halieaceae bacterium]
MGIPFWFRRMFGDVWRWAGQYRRTEKNLGIDPAHISVQTRNLLADARAWVDYATYSPQEAVVRLHYRLVSIHPFVNGNGRHARLLAEAMLRYEYGGTAIDWTGGGGFSGIEAQRRAYLDALRAADCGDLTPLLELVTIF